MFFCGDITLFIVMVFDDALDFGNLIGCPSHFCVNAFDDVDFCCQVLLTKPVESAIVYSVIGLTISCSNGFRA